MDYQKLNEIFSDLSNFYWNNRDKVVHTEEGSEGQYEGSYNSTVRVYDLGLPDKMFLKIEERTDSYGDNLSLHKIEFVKGKEKTVVVYEF